MKNVIFILSVTVLLGSCIKNEVDSYAPILKNEKDISSKVVKMSDLSGADSIRVSGALQRDKDLFLLMHIKCVDGKYTLDISPAIAAEFGVDMSVYEKYNEMISLLNQ